MLPEWRSLAHMQCPLSELLEFSAQLTIGAKISGFGGVGYLLVDKGTPIGAHFSDDYRNLKGNEALEYIQERPLLEYEIKIYNADELNQAINHCAAQGWMIPDSSPRRETMDADILVTEEKLLSIAKQRGVIVVSAFFEGFPVQSVGIGDFEYEAAIAEDLLRAGQKISEDLDIGPLDQMIIETPKGKYLIAPYQDLSLFVHATPDAHLGMIRLALKGIQ
jgi:predicted regulator of Ras-like GTPase activity (Roadblock/LC7/MglB family)